MKWINDDNSPTGERLVSNKEAEKSKEVFDLSRLKEESRKVNVLGAMLVKKHNPNLREDLEVFRKLQAGFVNDLNYLIDQGVITITNI